ncbi:hypothetical protein FRC03_009990 [Tulasnella sp. 419]|nr:hypothetical protein FRC03_009990 [Tulasnella sp. 419]
MSTNGLWIKESKVIKLTSSGQREVTLKRTDVDGTVYITRQAGDGTRRYFVQKDGIERPTDEKTPDVPPSSKSQSQSTRQSSSSRYSHTASASQPANFPPYAAPQPQTSANPATTAPRRSSPTYRVASPSPMDRASRSAERPPQPSASAQYPATAQPVPRRALSPVAGDRELRRNHTLPSMHSSAAAREPMPRPQSPHFYERSRTGSDALRMKTPTKMNPSYKPAIGPYESQPSSAATSRASSVEPGTNSTNEYGYTSSSRSKPTKSHSQPAAQPTSAPLSGSSRQRSSDHVSSVPSSATSAQFPAHAQMAKPQVQAPVPKMQQPPPPSYVQPPQMRSSSQQPTRPSHAAPQPAPQAVPQPVPKYPTSHSTTQGSSSRVPGSRAPSSRVTNGLGLGDVPPPPPTGSITGQSRAQEYLSRHQQQPMPVPRTTSYEYMAQPPPMMYTTAGPVPMHPQMNPAAAHYPHASAGAPHHQDYRAGRRMQHA